MYTLISQPERTDFPRELCFGSYDRRYILRDGVPYLCVWVPEKDLWVEEDVCIWGDFLLIGTAETLCCIRLDTLTVRHIPIDGYFKEFLATHRALYVFEATGITALDERCEILWQNHRLAVDGCLFVDMPDERTMRVACEMDPPGGWVKRTILIETGLIV